MVGGVHFQNEERRDLYWGRLCLCFAAKEIPGYNGADIVQWHRKVGAELIALSGVYMPCPKMAYN